jgi:4'-phosphopantetheinyl transferase
MERFRFAEDRRRFLVSHANLRILLGRYCGCEARAIAFETNEFGKPALKNGRSAETLRFNLSHSGDVGLLAATRVAEIGADVEYVRPIEQEVAHAHFSRRELAELETLQGTEWLTGFFNCWTRKEALLKAEGCGLNLSLDGFDVSLLPGEPAMLRDVRASVGMSRKWKLEHLEPGPGITGAIAVGADFAGIDCFRFTR